MSGDTCIASVSISDGLRGTAFASGFTLAIARGAVQAQLDLAGAAGPTVFRIVPIPGGLELFGLRGGGSVETGHRIRATRKAGGLW